MANTDRWIHIESSDEEPMQIAPTPPSIPGLRFSEVLRRSCGGTASSVFIALGSLFEIVLPTAKDNTLEYALQLRGNGNDGKLVLFSNDVTVKIKAMTEGLMCETAHDFRKSLVNPFSERFLWSGSSPRGMTWSCMDDFILKEKFYGHSNKLGAEEGLKGLKLIVLHNTRYAHASISDFQLRVKTVFLPSRLNFRLSFSERLLWRGNSLRGLTWSCMDDFILKEKLYGHSNIVGAEDGPKGL